MIRSRSRHRSTLLLVAAALVGQACGEPSQPSVSSVASPTNEATSAASSAGPFEPMAYPPTGSAPCDGLAPETGQRAYTGLIKRIEAVDATTVTFELCKPDVAFRTRLALAAFGINDTAWLQTHIDPADSGDPSILTQINGTGPYLLEAWDRGSGISLGRYDAYWGDAAQSERVVVGWRDDASARLNELVAGSVDGMDDIAPDDIDAVESNVELEAVVRPGLNVFYVGFNDAYAPFDNVAVRQAIAMGIDRDRIVEAFYPPGSEVATHFTPCSIPNGCTGDAWYEFDAAAAREMLADAGFPEGFDTRIQYRDVPRPYLGDPTAVATELQAQLAANLNIRAELEVIPDVAFLTAVDEGRVDGIHLLGRSVSMPDASPVLDPHFGVGASREFGSPNDGLVSALSAGAATIDEAARTAAYTDANNVIRANVPMIPIAHAGSMTAFRADVVEARSSPLGYERFASMTPGDRRQLVWLTAQEPDGLYCADETAATAQLICAQVMEGLYAFTVDGADVVPALAETCVPNPELTVWTCTLRDGVTFHDGARLDANDVVLSMAVQWDAEHPLHRGRDGLFQPFVDTFGGLLNAPASG